DAPGAPQDKLSYSIEVRPRGELVRIARTSFIAESSDLFAALERKPFTAIGAADVVIERGDRAALESALESLAPERPMSLDELADVTDAASQLEAHFISLEGDGSKTAKRAREVGRSATAKLSGAMPTDHVFAFSLWGRAREAGFVEKDDAVKLDATCPSDVTIYSFSAYAAALDAEPKPEAGGVRDCWTTFAARAVNAVDHAKQAGPIARAMLALAKRRHRADELKVLEKTLSELVELSDDGHVSLPAGTSRADRALVYAALLISTDVSKAPARRTNLVRWLLVQRDASGSFGSTAATRGAVQALIRESAFLAGDKAPVKVRIDFGKGGQQEVSVVGGEVKRLTVPLDATTVTIAPSRGAIMARLERTFLRSYDIAPEQGETPIEIKVDWPTAPLCSDEQAKKNACPTNLVAGKVGNVTLTLKTSARGTGPTRVDARIPLPVGVTLADTVAGVSQVQGALYVRTDVTSESRLLIPVRFGLAGKLTAREATARSRDDQTSLAVARARPITIKP
ncbi:MAG: hypothetical protein JNK04_19450, partial [Myxococcales bacterium]|nr:hypothetical protein [Myxococcales bacterium]